MNLNFIFKVLNRELVKIGNSPLNEVEFLIIQGIWDEKSYKEIAEDHGYSHDYLTNVVPPKLLTKLSFLLGDKVTKKKCRVQIEQYVKKIMSITFPNGVIPLNSPFYIERITIEKEILTEIKKLGGSVRIKAPQQFGKSSMFLRVMHHLDFLAYRTVSLDLKQVSQNSLNDIDKFLRWFSVNVALGLNLEPRLEGYWNENIGCKVSCTLYFQNYLLPLINSPLLLALDNLDLIFDYSEVLKDFLTLLYSWHEKARVLPLWSQLRLLVVHSTEIDVPLEIYQLLFHVGVTIHLDSFTLEEVMELVKFYELNWMSEKDIKLLMAMTDGHPALVHLAIYHLSQEKLTFMELLDNAPTSTGIYGSHLYRYQMKLHSKPELAIAFKTVINSTKPVLLNPILANKLSDMGLIKLNQNKAVISCQLYQNYFEQTL